VKKIFELTQIVFVSCDASSPSKAITLQSTSVSGKKNEKIKKIKNVSHSLVLRCNIVYKPRRLAVS
jgi:hypothetical protein